MQYMPDASSDTLRTNSKIQAEESELETNSKKVIPAQSDTSWDRGMINIFLKREQENV